MRMTRRQWRVASVALRKESVDRNNAGACLNILKELVALRKESVDRNLSSRPVAGFRTTVALRKESVDRNRVAKYRRILPRRSLSARRAWIEMISGLHPLMASLVALRKESVDRNIKFCPGTNTTLCRSPQGERG